MDNIHIWIRNVKSSETRLTLAKTDEFTFLFNHRTSHSREKLFYRLAQQAALIDPVLAKGIHGGIVDSQAAGHSANWSQVHMPIN